MTGASVTPTALVGPEGLEPQSRLHASHDIASAFTPGPWHVRSRPSAREVSVVYCGTRNVNYICAAGEISTAFQQDANANLIAAAPELYEALEAARCALHGKLLERADAAIAKARGEQVQP